MGNPHCNWVRGRLPLLAGGELPVADRRRVERHLIGCPTCRQRQSALELTADVLHTAAAQPSARPEAPSLWPELARQIRESRRPIETPRTAWSLPFLGSRPFLSLGLGLGLAAAVVVAAISRHQIDDARARMAVAARPLVPVSAVALGNPGAPSAETGPDAPRPAGDPVTIAEAVPATRLSYDLDHATPMGSDLREGKQPTY